MVGGERERERRNTVNYILINLTCVSFNIAFGIPRLALLNVILVSLAIAS